MLKTLTGLLALSVIVVAQDPFLTPPQAQSPSGYRCGFRDGNYCLRDNLESPFIVRCVGGKGVLGNCNDRFGVRGSRRNENPCYQPDPRKYDAACSTNRGMVYPENGRRPFLRPDYRPHHPFGLGGSEDLIIGDSLNRDTTSEKQFGRPGQGQGGYGSQGYDGRPKGGYSTYGGQGGYGGRPGQEQPPFGNGNNQNQNNNANNNINNNINNNVNNNANSNQNQNTNSYQNANPNNVGSLVGRPPVQRDVVKGEVGKRQEEDDTDRPCPDNGSNCDDDSEQGNKGDLIPPDGGDGTPGKRSEENTAKKGSSTRVEAKTCGIIVAMAVVIALV